MEEFELEEKRRTMLMRRASGANDDTEGIKTAIFEGRALHVSTESPSNPANMPVESTDPQRLFQLLRRKKKAPHSLGVSTPLSQPPQQPPPQTISPLYVTPSAPDASTAGPSSARGQPSSNDFRDNLGTAQRPVFSARPFSPADRPPTVSGREVHSAQPGGINGRPFTRQKHPKRSLDLFPPAGQSEPTDPFPKPQILRRASGSKVTGPTSVAGVARSGNAVNFNCLFFKSEDELDGANEFPQQHKPPVNIPLIETDWFSAASWEQLPTTDGAPQQHDEDLGPDCDEHSSDVYAESLYELLVASKRRPLAR